MSQLWPPQDKLIVRLYCQPPKSEQVRGFHGVGSLAFAPQIRLENATLDAVGAWVKWTEGNTEWSYVTYNPQPSQEEMITRGTMGSGGGPLNAFLKLVNDHADQISGEECGLIFAVPKDSTVMGFSFAQNTPDSTCQSPMKVSE